MLNVLNPDVCLRWSNLISFAELAGAGECFIGGGAIRDRLLGKDVVDTDIFFEPTFDGDLAEPRFSPADVVEKLASYARFTGLKQREQLEGKYMRHASAIWDATDRDLKPVNIIQVDSCEHTKRQFGCTLSEAFWTTKGLELTRGFLRAVANRELRFDTYNAREAYIAKIKAKFPEYGVLE